MSSSRCAGLALLALLFACLPLSAGDTPRRGELAYCSVNIRILNSTDLLRHSMARMDTIVTATLRQLLEEESWGWRSLDASARNQLSAKLRGEQSCDSIGDSLPTAALTELREEGLSRVGLFYNFRTSYGSAETGRTSQYSYRMQFGLLDVARNRFEFVAEARARAAEHGAGLTALLRELVRKAERELARRN